MSIGIMPFRTRLSELHEVIRTVATANGARDVRVFGSVATGEETLESDVDFLVTLSR